MVDPRYASVMRSTRSGNYYKVPLSANATKHAPDMARSANYDRYEHKGVTAAWGTSTMRRLPAVAKRRDLNSSLDGIMLSKDAHTFQPAFAFDLNMLVASLTKTSTSSSNSSSSGEPASEPMPEYSRIPEATTPEQRGRRGALSGEDELARSFSPSATTPPKNSIISYSLNKRKQRRLAAKALAAASADGPTFEVALADAGNEHNLQCVPRFVPEYQSDAIASRNRELSLDQQSYAL